MATKAEIEFKVYQGGVRIDSVSGTTFVNDPDTLLDKIKEFAAKAHPEVNSATIIQNNKNLSVGAWQIIAQDGGSGKTFLLLISKLN